MPDGENEPIVFHHFGRFLLIMAMVVVFLWGWNSIYKKPNKNDVIQPRAPTIQEKNLVELRELKSQFDQVKAQNTNQDDLCMTFESYIQFQSMSDYAQVIAPTEALAGDLLREAQKSAIVTRIQIKFAVLSKNFVGCGNPTSGADMIERLWGVMIIENPLYDPIMRETYRRFKTEEIRLLMAERKNFPANEELENHIMEVVLEATTLWNFTHEEIGAPE